LSRLLYCALVAPLHIAGPWGPWPRSVIPSRPIWRTGATNVTHFSRFSVFLRDPLSHHRWAFWGAVIRLAAQCGPRARSCGATATIQPNKKLVTIAQGSPPYRHGARAARQAYRTRRGRHCGLGMRHRPLLQGPDHGLSVPVAGARSLKVPQAQHLHVPSQSRRQFARALLSSTAWRRSAPDTPSSAWRTTAMPPRTLSGSCPRRSMAWGVSRGVPRSPRCPLLPIPRVVAPRAKTAP
jgi:hypothetical protein